MPASEEQPVNIPQIPIIVRPEPTGQFSAEPAGVPEIHVVAATAAQALAEAQQALAAWPGTVHWVQAPHHLTISALPAAAGHAKDDPGAAAYLEEIERYRREDEAREGSNSSSTPTT